jgi:hypothetical protein
VRSEKWKTGLTGDSLGRRVGQVDGADKSEEGKVPGVPLAQPPEYGERYVEELIPTYMWQCVAAFLLGILSPLFIAMPFAIVGIVFASRVESLRVQGRLFDAITASKSARVWMLFSLGFTVVPWVVRGCMKLAGHLYGGGG